MKKTALFFVSFVLVAMSLFGQTREVTLKGEVLDQHCYLIEHGKGLDHAGCSNACMSRNVSIGFLTEDGKYYLLLGDKMVSVKDQVAGMAGKPMMLTGRLVERDGHKAIHLVKIEEAK